MPSLPLLTITPPPVDSFENRNQKEVEDTDLRTVKQLIYVIPPEKRTVQLSVSELRTE